MKNEPLFFSIQNFCLQDGPGIRSIVFFKGCPLRCVWCHNPESWSPHQQLAYKQHLCIKCGKCVEVCPEGIMDSPGKWDLKKCTLCFKCVENCPSEALIYFGFNKSVESILDELRPEYTYFKNSNGGVTLSGGEATLFADYAGRLTKALKSEGVNVALESCGHFKLENKQSKGEKNDSDDCCFHGRVWEFISQLDLILFDVKVFDNDASRKLVGVNNENIKKNLRSLSSLMKKNAGPRIWPRLPLIPTMTNTKENLSKWANFLLEIGINRITVIPYHNLGESKRTWIGIDIKNDIPDLTDDDHEAAKKILNQEGITCYSPGEEDW